MSTDNKQTILSTIWPDWQQAFILYIPRLLAVIAIIVATIFAAYYCRKITKKIKVMQKNKLVLVNYMMSLLSTMITIIGFITALATAGINVTALVASLGLLGFSLGLAFKDLLANAISGIMILIHQPFKVGDQISIAQSKGMVSDINLRYTTLASENNDKKHILIPNQNLVNSNVEVITREKT